MGCGHSVARWHVPVAAEAGEGPFDCRAFIEGQCPSSNCALRHCTRLRDSVRRQLPGVPPAIPIELHCRQWRCCHGAVSGCVMFHAPLPRARVQPSTQLWHPPMPVHVLWDVEALPPPPGGADGVARALLELACQLMEWELLDFAGGDPGAMRASVAVGAAHARAPPVRVRDPRLPVLHLRAGLSSALEALLELEGRLDKKGIVVLVGEHGCASGCVAAATRAGLPVVLVTEGGPKALPSCPQGPPLPAASVGAPEAAHTGSLEGGGGGSAAGGGAGLLPSPALPEHSPEGVAPPSTTPHVFWRHVIERAAQREAAEELELRDPPAAGDEYVGYRVHGESSREPKFEVEPPFETRQSLNTAWGEAHPDSFSEGVHAGAVRVRRRGARVRALQS